MGKVIAAITTSVDGYITGPDDGPHCGLGIGGERLHYWVFGGPWTYDTPERGEPLAEDKAWFDRVMADTGAVIGGRATYEAAGHWGGANPFGVPFFILTHRPQEQPTDGGFVFVNGLDRAVEQATAAAQGRNVNLMGGADTIRQALNAEIVEELRLIMAPVVLGAGKRLFDAGFTKSIELEQVSARQSPLATFIHYRVNR